MTTPNSVIISYPKSGRTWLKALIGHYLVAKSPEIASDKALEFIFETPEITQIAGLSKTSFSHAGAAFYLNQPASEYSFPSEEKYNHDNIVFLSREIKDTLVSSYFQRTRRYGPKSQRLMNANGEGQLTFSEFLADDRVGLNKVLTFYKRCYEKFSSVDGEVLFVTYEQLHRDTPVYLMKVLNFLGEEDVCLSSLNSAISRSSFDQMRQDELTFRTDQGGLRTAYGESLAPGLWGETVDSEGRSVMVVDPESLKTRKGKVGGYINYLQLDQIEMIDEAVKAAGLEGLNEKR